MYVSRPSVAAMTDRQLRVYFALVLLGATIFTGSVVPTLVLRAYACRDGDTPAYGYGGEPGSCLAARDFVLGYITGSTCVLSFFWFAYYYKFFSAAAAKKASRGDAEAAGLDGGRKK